MSVGAIDVDERGVPVLMDEMGIPDFFRREFWAAWGVLKGSLAPACDGGKTGNREENRGAAKDRRSRPEGTALTLAGAGLEVANARTIVATGA